ncbi:hypothetical protein [Streptomyces sp. cg2]|uniref:hypothetical protein n=1 Tax=Streptomyces sp. cg2 TaxID=3238799 RepID=UPI0034E20AC7
MSKSHGYERRHNSHDHTNLTDVLIAYESENGKTRTTDTKVVSKRDESQQPLTRSGKFYR